MVPHVLAYLVLAKTPRDRSAFTGLLPWDIPSSLTDLSHRILNASARESGKILTVSPFHLLGPPCSRSALSLPPAASPTPRTPLAHTRRVATSYTHERKQLRRRRNASCSDLCVSRWTAKRNRYCRGEADQAPSPHTRRCALLTLPTSFADLTDRSSLAEAKEHEIANILLDQKSINGVRFSVHRTFWAEFDFFHTLEERVFGTFVQWVRTATLRPKIRWDDGGEDTEVSLCDLLPASLGMKLEHYANNLPPPKAAGRRRRGAAGPDGDDENDDGDSGHQQLIVPYKLGARDCEQVWYYHLPIT